MASKQTQFKFEFSGNPPAELIIEGDAQYPEESPVLRLTKTNNHQKALQNSTGRVHYSKDVLLGPKAVFNTTVNFTIKPNFNTYQAGDGLAFYIVPKGNKFPNAVGNLGLFDESGTNPSVFAVALDLHLKREQVILAIDLGERNTPKASTPVPNVFVGKNLTLTVSYDGNSSQVIARVTDGTEVYEITGSVDLGQSQKPIVQVGLASSTSDFIAIHDVYSWEFTSSAP